MAALTITTDRTPEGILIHLDGAGDAEGTPVLERELTRLSALKPKLVVVDAANLTFLSSLAMGRLMAFGQSISRAKGRIIIAAAPPEVKTALERAGLKDAFGFHDNAWAALAAG
jgi:anti-anti-sigma factor